VVELKGRLAPGTLVSPSTPMDGAAPMPSDRQHDAVMALVALGYKAADADKAVRQAWLALGASASTEALIKKALG
jgi:Holliday junction DNA helicase RuvA